VKPVPIANAETAAFWAGCNEGRLLLQRCGSCDARQFYPRLLCTRCGSRELEWQAASGAATIRTFTIIRRAVSEAFESDVPYVVALVALAEGPTLMSNIVDCDPEALFIGQPVTLTFEQRGDQAIPQFTPD
jgi:uncharacterized OB-fold protein